MRLVVVALAAVLVAAACNVWPTVEASAPPPFDARLGNTLKTVFPTRELPFSAAPAGGGAVCVVGYVFSGPDFAAHGLPLESFALRVDGDVVTPFPALPAVAFVSALVSADGCTIEMETTDDAGVTTARMFLSDGSAWTEVPAPDGVELETVDHVIGLPSRGMMTARTGDVVSVYDGSTWKALATSADSRDLLSPAALDGDAVVVVSGEGTDAVVRRFSVSSGAQLAAEGHIALGVDPIEPGTPMSEARTGTVAAGLFKIGNRVVVRTGNVLTLGSRVRESAVTPATRLAPMPGSPPGAGLAIRDDQTFLSVADGVVGEVALDPFAPHLECTCDRLTDPTCPCIVADITALTVPVAPTSAVLLSVSDLHAVRRLAARTLALPTGATPLYPGTPPDCAPACDTTVSHCHIISLDQQECATNEHTFTQLLAKISDPTGADVAFTVTDDGQSVASGTVANGGQPITIEDSFENVFVRFTGSADDPLEIGPFDATLGTNVDLPPLSFGRGRDAGAPDPRVFFRGDWGFVVVDDQWTALGVLPGGTAVAKQALGVTASTDGGARLLRATPPIALVATTTGAAVVDIESGAVLDTIDGAVDLAGARFSSTALGVPFVDGLLGVYAVDGNGIVETAHRTGPGSTVGVNGDDVAWNEAGTAVVVNASTGAALSLGADGSPQALVPAGAFVVVTYPDGTTQQPCETDGTFGCVVEVFGAGGPTISASAVHAHGVAGAVVAYTQGSHVLFADVDGVAAPVSTDPPVNLFEEPAVTLGGRFVIFAGPDLIAGDVTTKTLAEVSDRTRIGVDGWHVLGVDDDGCATVETGACTQFDVPGCKIGRVCAVAGALTVDLVLGTGPFAAGAAVADCPNPSGDQSLTRCLGDIPFAMITASTIDPVHADVVAPFAPCLLYENDPGGGLPVQRLCTDAQ